jgi:hypothetical protein
MEFEEDKEKEEERKRQEVVVRKETGTSKDLYPLSLNGY